MKLSNDFNKITLIGQITKVPELRKTKNGTSVTNFVLTTKERWIDKEENKKKHELSYHKIVAWGKTAEFISKTAKKGMKILIQGQLTYRDYEKDLGKESIKFKIAEVKAIEVLPLIDPKILDKENNE